MQDVQALEVEIAPVHHVVGSGLEKHQVENIDIMRLAIGNHDKIGDIAPEI